MQELMEKAVVAAGGTQRKAAEQLGITEGWLSRVKSGEEGVLGVEPCLLLADLVGERPQAVLRAFGHELPAAKLDKWFGAKPPSMPPQPEDRIVLGLVEVLAKPKADRDGALTLVNMLRRHAGLPAIEEPPARRRGRPR